MKLFRRFFGRFKRSDRERHRFLKMTGYPAGRPGWIVDHIIPLKRGGADVAENMQWQTLADAAAKDRVE